MAPTELTRMTAAELAAAIASGETSAVDVAQAHLDRIEAVDGRDLLIKHGVAVTPKKLACDQTWQCWCKDPDGTDVEFQQYTPKSSQFTRANCSVDW